MTRPITAHKGGRTARAPQARIRPQTLRRIHETMRERGKTFADLIEEQYGGNMIDEQRQQELNKRYNSDPVFHNLVNLLVQCFETGKLDRYAAMDAITQAERIAWFNSQKA